MGEQTETEKNIVLQDMIPSECQIEEVVQPCGILNQHIAASEGKKKKAKKSRDSSISRVQEAILPIESTTTQEQTKPEKENVLQDMIPSESQMEEVIQPCDILI